MQSTQAPVLIFPDGEDTEGVLVWPADRNFLNDDPFELVEVPSPNARRVCIKIVDHKNPNRELPKIHCHLEGSDQDCEFELLLDGGSISREELNFYCLVLENIRHNPGYLSRLRRQTLPMTSLPQAEL